MGKKLFDYVIGNPPYQEEKQGDSNTATPIYHQFMNAAYETANTIMLITPARFLFNAGYTPKEWNKKMLNDEHFKVLFYEPDCTKVSLTPILRVALLLPIETNRRFLEQ